MFNDYLATLPSKVVEETVVDAERVSLPTTIDIRHFEATFRDRIEEKELTPEKAVYLASTRTPKQRKSVSDLLRKGR